MSAPRWIFISFMVLVSLLGLCSGYRPLAAANDEDNDGNLSKNDFEFEAVVIGTELCDERGCFEPEPPDCGGCGSCHQTQPPCEPPVVVEPCLPPLPPVIILPPLPPPIEVEPCLPPLPPVILPLPPVVLPPADCPVPSPCSDGGICIDLQGKVYDENAMEQGSLSQAP